MSRGYQLFKLVPRLKIVLGIDSTDVGNIMQVLNIAQPSGKFWVGIFPDSGCPAVILTSIFRAELQ